MKRRAFLTRSLGLVSAAAGLTLAGPGRWVHASPSQSHRILDLELFDRDRGRRIPARLHLPPEANPTQPVPLVVFSHGLGGSRSGYRYLASHWVGEGMASLHLQHVGSDERVWRGNPLELVQRLQTAARASEARARAQDVHFALDQLLASELALLFDGSRIAAAGHSYGANTAMLISGAQVGRTDGDTEDLRDKRIRATILISAPPLAGQGPIARVLGAVAIPTLHITSIEDTIALPGYRSTVEDRIAIFDAMHGSSRTLAVFNTGGHSIFTDRTTLSGPDVSARVKSATRELCAVFLRETLLVADRAASVADFPRPAPSDGAPSTLREDRASSPEIARWIQRHQDLLARFIRSDRSLAEPPEAAKL